MLITFDLYGLPPGAHGIHLHTSGNCNAKTGFTAAGPDPEPGAGQAARLSGRRRARWPATCPTSSPAPTGACAPAVETGSFTLGNGKRSIFDRDGVALIVNQRADDYRTQPLGNAGDRIACGVVMRTVGPAPAQTSAASRLQAEKALKRRPGGKCLAPMTLSAPPWAWKNPKHSLCTS